MTDSADELRELLDDAGELPPGEAQVEAYQEVVRRAEAAGLVEVEIEARIDLLDAMMETAKDIPDINEVITKFTRTVALYTEHPDRFGDELLDEVWRQFAAQGLVMVCLPDYPLRLIHGVFDDMERRCRPDRDDLHTVLSLRFMLADVTGDREAGDRAMAALRGREAAEYACPACLITDRLGFLADTGRDAAGIELAEPILSGDVGCITDDQPAKVLHRLQNSYLRTGDLDRARDAHRYAYRHLSLGNESDVAHHLTFCVLSGNTDRALSIVRRDMTPYEETPTMLYQLRLIAAAAMVFSALVDEGRGEETLIWPPNPDYPDEQEEEWSFAALAELFTADATEVAGRYDERNGNTHMGDRVKHTIATRPIVDRLPLDPVAARHRELEQEPAPAQSAPSGVAEPSGTSAASTPAASTPASSRAYDQESARPIAVRHAERGDELAEAGRDDEAIKEYIEAAARFAALGDKRSAARARVRLATSYLAVGRELDAAECAEEVLPDVVPEDDAAYSGLQARWVLAWAYPELGQPDDGLAMLAEMADRTSEPAALGRLRHRAGVILGIENRDAEAAERFLSAAGTFRAAGDRAMVTRCELMAARFLYGLDDHAGAEQAARRALAESPVPDDDDNAGDRTDSEELLTVLTKERPAG